MTDYPGERADRWTLEVHNTENSLGRYLPSQGFAVESIVFTPFHGTTPGCVAQLDRALPSGGRGRGFESRRIHTPNIHRTLHTCPFHKNERQIA